MLIGIWAIMLLLGIISEVIKNVNKCIIVLKFFRNSDRIIQNIQKKLIRNIEGQECELESELIDSI